MPSPAQATAGTLLLSALAAHGITPQREPLSYVTPLAPGTTSGIPLDFPHLYIADQAPGIDHAPNAHTGWIVVLHDANGEPVRELYNTSGEHVVDCATDSAAAAKAIVVEQRRAVLRATVLPRAAAPEYTIAVNGDTVTVPWETAMASAQKSIRAGARIAPGDAGAFTLTAPNGVQRVHFQPA
ncbi:hypothetical protein [Streptomyces chartreusis]|uniref:Uncharacterized protein n=1 Tax=Streptomyces chartreusis TaxID=1969 RepID=A0A7H8TE11_STRCX|nr:hypothetical protein [Streptomyces chartreusis]QKZ20280.1 hypothetical protein HUT05_24765 [Streptomyces chartreusis]